jgi:hypothetical protein
MAGTIKMVSEPVKVRPKAVKYFRRMDLSIERRQNRALCAAIATRQMAALSMGDRHRRETEVGI